MSVRRAYVAALVLALAALVAYLVIPAELGRRDRAAIARAHRIADALPEIRTADRDPDTVTADVVTELRAMGHRAASLCAEGLRLRDGTQMRDCWVRTETGRGHGVLVMVHSGFVVVDGKPAVRGSTIDVSVV